MLFARVRSLVVAAVATALLLPALAGAQPGPATASTAQDQHFEFGDELVQSSLRRPDQVTARARLPRSGRSLIRHRAHFVPEMLRSIERL